MRAQARIVTADMRRTELAINGQDLSDAIRRVAGGDAVFSPRLAGFVLDAESTLLANRDDQHSIKVFDPSIKGETDRFAYRFVKP